MAILKYANQSGVVYAYESISEWDPIKKQSRSKRRCIGRVDPETGEIIPTAGKRGRQPKHAEKAGSHDDDGKALSVSNYEKLKADYEKLKADYEEIRMQNLELVSENKKLRNVISIIEKSLASL